MPRVAYFELVAGEECMIADCAIFNVALKSPVASQLGAEAIHTFCKALDKLRRRKGQALDSAAVERVLRNLQPPLDALLAEVSPLLHKSSCSAKETTKLLLVLDALYFEMMYSGLTEAAGARSLLATPLPPPPAPAEDDAGSAAPAEVRSRDAHASAELVRSPAAFFGRSHTTEWQAAQRERLRALCAKHQIPTEHCASSATLCAWLRTVRRGWCHEVAVEMARELLAPPPDVTETARPPKPTTRMSIAVPAPPPNNLLRVWRERVFEAVDLLQAGGAASREAYDVVLPAAAASARDAEPPAPALVKRWRKMDRQWPCWSMAFAVPSETALVVLSMHAPIVEMGAGTGFWVHLLRERGIDATALDIQPPSLPAPGPQTPPRRLATNNTFHGRCPAYTTVERGEPSVLSQERWRQHALLLCYPPNGLPMAAQSLAHFCGETVLHVGEWHGDTGDAAFERALAREWELTARLPLPCWGDTVEDLTVWSRRKEPLPAPPQLHPILSCDHCGKPSVLTPSSKEGVRLRRCRYCRLACYCSAECEKNARTIHERYHAVKFITLQRPLDFEGRDYHAVI